MTLGRMGKAALEYAKRSWPVFPCCWPSNGKCACGANHLDSIGKAPITRNGLKDASIDPGVLTFWWEKYPEANIGLVTGSKSKLVVIDLDIKKDGIRHWDELLDQNGRVDTLTSLTGSGGRHLIFTWPDALRNTASQIAPGIDTRGDGGYIIAPPSLHLSGQRYEWDNKTPPVAPPGWLLKLWPIYQATSPNLNGSQSTLPASDHPHWVTEALDNGTGEGGRNQTATRLAGYFRSKNIPRDVVLRMMQPFAAKCHPPMLAPELERCLNSVQRYAVQVAEAGISDPPLFESKAGLLVYTWEKPGITVSLEQLHSNKQGIHAVMAIHALEEGKKRKVHGPVNYNLLSTTSRESLLKYLKGRMEIDWAEILETLTDLANTHLQTGEPVGNLLEYMDRPTTKWALFPLILEDQSTILFGPGGMGKSMLALAAMLTLETGRPFLPGLTPQSGHHGLYLDWEATKYEHGGRLRSILSGADATVNSVLEPACEVLHLSCAGSIIAMQSQIKRQIDEYGITFLIVDSAGLACGNEPEKAESALAFFDSLRQLGVPALVIAHQTKNDAHGMPFGSVFWHNSARSTWEIRKQQEAGENLLTVGLFHRKSNVGKMERPLGFSFDFGPDGATCIKRVEVRDVPEFSREGSFGDRIAGALMHGAMTVKQIAEAIDGKPDTVVKTLKRQTHRFTVVASSLGTQVWGLRIESNGQ